MARPPFDPADTPADFDLSGYLFPTHLSDRSAAGPQLVIRTHTIRQIVVIEVEGRLGDVVDELDWAIQMALASGPRGVVCDLSAVTGCSDTRGLEMLATAGRHVRNWHGVPVALAIPDPRVRDALSTYLLAGLLIVRKSVLSTLYAVLRTPTPTVKWLRVSPHPTSPRASREFVTRTLVDWDLDNAVTPACLVISELVTNSTLHDATGNDIDVSLARNGRDLRLTVRDHSPELPRQHHNGLGPHGRGLTIVAGFSRGYGVLPTAEGGKVVWAVLDASGPGRSIADKAAESAPTSSSSSSTSSSTSSSASTSRRVTRSPRLTDPSIVQPPTGRTTRAPENSCASKQFLPGNQMVLITRTSSPRPFAVGRVGPSQRPRPRPDHEPADDLG